MDISRFQIRLEVPSYEAISARFKLKRDPWALCMFDYASGIGALLEERTTRYEGEAVEQPIDFRNIAVSKAFLHGIDIETLFRRSQWDHIDAVFDRMNFTRIPALDMYRHWGSDKPPALILNAALILGPDGNPL